MILALTPGLSSEQTQFVQDRLLGLGLHGQIIHTHKSAVLVITDDTSTFPTHVFSQIPGVEKAVRVHGQYKLSTNQGALVINVDGVKIGSAAPVFMAGPCSVEGLPQLLATACKVKECGATILRGGAFKPRTSPYDFQGLGIDGLKYLREAKEATGLPIVSEVMSAQQVFEAQGFIDIFQIGARNMYNYELLKEVGRSGVPVLLKRGISATVHEFLNAAEYVIHAGNPHVILCERGIRTFETVTRNTLDLNAVAVLKRMTHLPVIVDPSHGTGRSDIVAPLSRAAIACGADGLLIETHDTPAHALSDGEQAVTSTQLSEIIADCQRIWSALQPGATLLSSPPLVPQPSAI